MYLLPVSPWLFLLALTQLNNIVTEDLFTVAHLLNTFESFVFAVFCREVVERRPNKSQLNAAPDTKRSQNLREVKTHLSNPMTATKKHILNTSYKQVSLNATYSKHTNL